MLVHTLAGSNSLRLCSVVSKGQCFKQLLVKVWWPCLPYVGRGGPGSSSSHSSSSAKHCPFETTEQSRKELEPARVHTSTHRQRSSLTTNLLLHLRLTTQSSDMGLQGIQPEGSFFAATAPITTCGTTLQMVFFLLRSFVLVLQTLSLTTTQRDLLRFLG